MKKQFFSQKALGRVMALTVILFTMMLMVNETVNARTRSKKAPPPEKVEAIIIGDRVVDIAYNLDVLPVAMSVRGSLWPMADEIKTSSQILGCPMFTTVKKKQTIPKALKKFRPVRLVGHCPYRISTPVGSEFEVYRTFLEPSLRFFVPLKSSDGSQCYRALF